MSRARRIVVVTALGGAATLSLAMAACSQPRATDPDVAEEASAPVEPIFASDTVEGLTADPQRLDTVQEGSRTNQPWAREALCVAAAEARRRRFRGEGVPYTPKSADPFPSRPEPSPPVRTQ